MADTPRWVPILFGCAMILISALILGAVTGVVPTGDGTWSIPPMVVASLGLCLLLIGAAMAAPEQAPAILRGGLFTFGMFFMAVFCNWTAFAPSMTYESSISLGPLAVEGQDQLGGRIVFGLAVIVVDLVLLSAVWGWVRPKRKKKV